MGKKDITFGIIHGNGKIEGGAIKYHCETNNPSGKEQLELLVRASETFSNGTLEFKVKLVSLKSGVLAVLKTQEGNTVICGATLSEHKFVIATVIQDISWIRSSIAGDLNNYDADKPITFKIEVVGSTITLSINDVIMCKNVAVLKNSPLEFKCSSKADLEIYDIKVESSKPEIFVAMQYTAPYFAIYEEVINPIVTQFGYTCSRGDLIYTPTPILKDITDSISKSVAIIADITPDNPNVFYEIGYSHAIGRPTILLCDTTRPRIPFDVSGFRTIYYENTIPGKSEVEKNLTLFLKTLKGTV